ncbi:MAG: hypothetical protein WAM82_08640 [Thermoanaerobaculia bacterium]
MSTPPRSTPFLVSCLGIAVLLGSIALQPAAASPPRWQGFGPGGGKVASLAVDPTSPKTLYALVARFDLYADNAIFRSTDGAISWTRMWKGLPVYPEAFYPQALALDPSHPWVVYTALCLHSAGHVFRSSDGESWARQTPPQGLGNAGTGVTSRSCLLTVAPGKLGALYFAMGTRLLRSLDRGLHWTVALDTPTEILSIFVDPARPWLIYVGTAEGGGLWRSTGRGSSFYPVAGGPTQVQAMAANRTEAFHTLYMANGSAIYANSDRDFGRSWAWQGDTGWQISALAVDARSPRVLYAAHEQGVSVSRDGGATWTLASQGLPNVRRADSNPPYGVVKVFALTAHPTKPGWLYAGTELAGVYQSNTGGQTWQAGDQQGLGGVPIDQLVFDPLHPGTICTVENGQGGLWCSANGGKNWNRKSTTLSRGFQISGLQFDPSTPNALVAIDRFDGDVVLFRSLDIGVTWTPISRFDPQSYTVFDSAVVDQGALLLAAEQGLLRSTDEGRSWTSVLPVGGLKLVVDPEDPTTVYLLALAQSGGGGYRSRDAGRTWTYILPQATAIATTSSPAYSGSLYALAPSTPGKTEILYSRDHGDTWLLGGYFTDDTVTNLAAGRYQGGRLFLGTSHRGVYWSNSDGNFWTPAAELPRLGYYADYWVFADPNSGRVFAMPLEGGGLFVGQFLPR